MFDCEHVIALHVMKGNWASYHGDGDVSCFFLSCGRTQWYILDLRWGCSFKAPVCSATSRLLSSYEGHLRYLLEASQGNTNASGGEAGDPGYLTSCHCDTGIPNNFKKESGIVTF